ncbi:MAG: response regulator [Chloroflexi bacterium]|nr:response regulator [Chloroflexota bacterium]
MVDGKKLVLVVDDDPDLLTMFEMVLESCGVGVCLASNGAEALDLVAKDVPDLIFLDIRMPIMNGQEFAEQLRERCQAEVPIVVLTAAVDGRARAEEMGAQGFLAKPFEIGDLLDKVEHFTQA